MSNQGLFGFPTGDNGKNDTISYANFARNFGLSPSDMGKVVNVNTHNGYNLVLPDARQLSTQRFIIIKNNATTNLLVTNNGGIGIKTLAPNSSVALACSDITTANGVWAGTAGTSVSSLFVGNNTTIYNNSGTVLHDICALSENTCVVTFNLVGNLYLQAVAMTVSGTTLTIGSPVQVSYNAGTIVSPKLRAINSASAVVSYGNAGSSVSANVLTVSGGTTISVGATATNTGGGANYLSMCLLSPSAAIVCRGDNSHVLTISGNTCSFNTGYSLISTAGASYHSICALDSTHAVAFYSNGTDRYASVFTVSGTGISSGSAYLVTSGSDVVSICALDSNHAVAFYRAVGGYAKAKMLNIAGSVISIPGSELVIDAVVSDFRSITALSATSALVFYQTTSSYAASNTLTINPSTGEITASAKTAVYNSAAQYESVSSLNNTTAVAFYQGVSNYAYANVLAYTQ